MVNRFSYRRRGSKNVRRSTRRRRSGRRKSLFEGLIKMNRRGRRMIFNRKGRWGVAERLRRFSTQSNHHFTLESFRPLLLPPWSIGQRRENDMLNKLADDAPDFNELNVPQWLCSAKLAKLRVGDEAFFAKNEAMLARKAPDNALHRLHANFEKARGLIGLAMLDPDRTHVEPALANLVACYEDVFART